MILCPKCLVELDENGKCPKCKHEFIEIPGEVVSNEEFHRRVDQWHN